MSTDATTRAIADLFNSKLLPLSEQIARGNPGAPAAYFARKPDPAVKSYYQTRERKAMRPEDFEIPGLTPVANDADRTAALERAFTAFWTARRNPELLPLAGPLADLANRVRFVEERNAEVSPFMYVMF